MSSGRRTGSRGRTHGTLRAKIFSLLDWLFGGGFEEMDFGFSRPQGFDLEVRNDEMVITAHVPGYTLEEIDIELSGNVLTIRAARNLVTTRSLKEILERRACRAFTQSLLLPAAGDREKMETVYRDGVLKVYVPKRSMARSQAMTSRS
jgi:HSP20 family molecular chaperone IbpA